jgi:hypothetical protein
MAIDVGREELIESPMAEQADTQGEAFVLGIPALTPAELVVVAETEAGRVCSEPQAIEAAALPADLPELTLTISQPDQIAGGTTLLSLLVEGPNYVVAIDEYGQYTWVLPVVDLDEFDGSSTNSAVFSQTQTQPSILFPVWAKGADDDALIYRVGLDGELLETVVIPGGQKDFVELPDGSMGAIGWDIREVESAEGETYPLLGDHIIEVSPTGETRVVWSTFDSWTPDPTLDYSPGGYVPDPNARDWSHMNGISYDEASDAYLVSVFGLGSVAKIDRQSGEAIWIMANQTGDYSSASSDALIQGTHSVEVLAEDRILVFNRNITNPFQEDGAVYEERCSEAVEIEMNLETGEAQRAWSYGTDECLLVVFFGEARRLENGNTMVIFSSSGQVSEATPEGETVWQINTDVGGAFGFGERIDSLY